MAALTFNYWNEVLGFYATDKQTFVPVYWQDGGWRLFYTSDTGDIIGFDSLPSCLMFLETAAEMPGIRP